MMMMMIIKPVYTAGQRPLHPRSGGEDGYRSDSVLTHRESLQTRSRASSRRSHHHRRLRHPVQRARAAGCSDHQRDGRTRGTKSVQDRRHNSGTSAVYAEGTAAAAVNLIQLCRAYRHDAHHLTHLRPALRHIFLSLRRHQVAAIHFPWPRFSTDPVASSPRRIRLAQSHLRLQLLRLFDHGQTVSLRTVVQALPFLSFCCCCCCRGNR